MSTSADSGTRLSLVNGLLDAANHAAWERFRDKYGSRLRQICARAGRRFRLQPADVDDVVAEVLVRVAEAMHDGWAYNPAQSFRGWLATICYHEAQRHLGRANRLAVLGGAGTGDSGVLAALHEVAAPEAEDEAEAVTDDWAKTVRTAAERVRAAVDPEHWECFWLNGVERIRADEVAARLGLTEDAVWANKSRVAKRVRAEVQRLLEEGA